MQKTTACVEKIGRGGAYRLDYLTSRERQCHEAATKFLFSSLFYCFTPQGPMIMCVCSYRSSKSKNDEQVEERIMSKRKPAIHHSCTTILRQGYDREC